MFSNSPKPKFSTTACAALLTPPNGFDVSVSEEPRGGDRVDCGNSVTSTSGAALASGPGFKVAFFFLGDVLLGTLNFGFAFVSEAS